MTGDPRDTRWFMAPLATALADALRCRSLVNQRREDRAIDRAGLPNQALTRAQPSKQIEQLRYVLQNTYRSNPKFQTAAGM